MHALRTLTTSMLTCARRARASLRNSRSIDIYLHRLYNLQPASYRHNIKSCVVFTTQTREYSRDLDFLKETYQLASLDYTSFLYFGIRTCSSFSTTIIAAAAPASSEQRTASSEQRQRTASSAILLFVYEHSWRIFHNCARYCLH